MTLRRQREPELLLRPGSGRVRARLPAAPSGRAKGDTLDSQRVLDDLLSEVRFRFQYISMGDTPARGCITRTSRSSPGSQIQEGLGILDDISAPSTPSVRSSELRQQLPTTVCGASSSPTTRCRRHGNQTRRLRLRSTRDHRPPRGAARARYEYKDTTILYVATSDHRSSTRKLSCKWSEAEPWPLAQTATCPAARSSRYKCAEMGRRLHFRTFPEGSRWQYQRDSDIP